MKMENELLAEYSGCVVSVNVSEGDRVAAGTELITIE
jgi:biotin carboxyl carrier protein